MYLFLFVQAIFLCNFITNGNELVFLLLVMCIYWFYVLLYYVLFYCSIQPCE